MRVKLSFNIWVSYNLIGKIGIKMAQIKIIFLQLEIIPHCPPHIGMCFFIDDLKKKGISCDAFIINFNYVEEILPIIEKGDYSLICLDSIFTIDIIKLFTEHFPDIPILVGGINALALLIHTEIKYAVLGPGRDSIISFVEQYFGSKDFNKVPNLFYKDGNYIFYSGITRHWNLEEELFPYSPFLDWEYIGHSRDPMSNFNDISIVAGTGCPYANSNLSSCHFSIDNIFNELGYTISENAKNRLEVIFNRKHHGCSFCIYQFFEYSNLPVIKTTEILLKQVLYLQKTHNTTSFQIQTENPFPFLNHFLSSMVEKKISFNKISIRTRVDLLLRYKERLLEALNFANKKGFCISIEQIGFESFYRNDLLIFDKNIEVEKNKDALNLLREIKNSFKNNVNVDIGHGIILFHPWTTIESITENLVLLAKYNDIFPSFFAGNLILYSEFLPIYSKIKRENLVKNSEYFYGYEYIMKDPLANKAFELYQILLSYFGGNISIEDYLKSLEMIKNNYSINEILENIYNLIPR